MERFLLEGLHEEQSATKIKFLDQNWRPIPLRRRSGEDSKENLSRNHAPIDLLGCTDPGGRYSYQDYADGIVCALYLAFILRKGLSLV